MSNAPAVFETERQKREQRWQRRHELVTSEESENNPVIAGLETSEGRTEAATARRLVNQHGNEIRWVPDWQKFLTWDGRCWELDSPEIEKKAKASAQLMEPVCGDVEGST
jgi:hypothetical protein